MTHPATGGPRSPTLADKVFALIDHHGSPEERRLLKPHAEAVRAFLDHPAVNLNSRRTELDIGLENTLSLKFNLVASGNHSPWSMVDQLASWAPSLQEVAELVLMHRLRCHAGFKVTRSGIEYEIYPYETPDALLARRWGIADPAITRLPVTPYCYGVSSTGTLSAYARVDDVPASELEGATGLHIAVNGLKTRALFHSRRDAGGAWSADKAGIEFLPFPSYLLNTAMQQFALHFSYLVHRGGIRPYGVIGVRGDRRVLYTTLVPRPPKRLHEIPVDA